jgi:O-antigen ligase/tetratricopeptide (TPR) repeat protein
MFWPILFLIPFTALALGGVHLWAFGLAELVSFALVAVWMAQVVTGRYSLVASSRGAGVMTVLALGLAALVALQLLPLPPETLKLLSPESYTVYSDGLPGWPAKPAYQFDSAPAAQASSGHYMPWTPDEVRAGVQIPFVDPTKRVRNASPTPYLKAGTWMPLSIAPPMTRVGLLKLLMYCALGLLLILYPFSADQQTRLYKNVVRAVLVTGLVVSLVGLAEQQFPNGKPLWIFSPYDWAHHQPWGARCFGPFANPDHFADYLAMVWPFALAGMLFPNLLGRVRDRMAVPILCGTVGLVVLAALLATASRGGWLAAIAGSVVVLAVATHVPADEQPAILHRGKSGSREISLGVTIAAALCLALLFTSNSSRYEADARLHSAVYHESIWGRTQPARDSIAMIHDFPLFGVGLGAWPEIYPKYAPPPWGGLFMNATHDEYVQFLAEVGLVGLVLGGGFLVLAMIRVVSGLMTVPPDLFATAAACAGALAAIAIHSMFDFPLRIPANAILATICLGILLRMCVRSTPHAKESALPRLRQRGAAAATIAACIIAITVALRQQRQPFPYDVQRSLTVDEAVVEIERYPADAGLHVALAHFLISPEEAPMRAAEVKAALALEPTNPGAHDLRATELVVSGDKAQALRQIEQSLFYAPSFATHYYLNARYLPWLLPDEQDAIIAGLKRAAAAGYLPATDTLSLFYENLGRVEEEGEFFEQAASSASDPIAKSTLLSRAGAAFVKAGKRAHAVRMLKEAIAVDPRNADAYRDLALGVDSQDGNPAHARQIIRSGIAAGAPATALYEALAEVEITNRNLAAAEDALGQAVLMEPYNFELVHRLGNLYASDNKLDSAIAWLHKAVQLNPESATAFFDLAQTEEANYQFFAAKRDYTNAITLDASNAGYRARYAYFKQKIAEATSR